MKSCSKRYFAAACFKMQMLLGFCLFTFYVSSQSGKIDGLKRAFLLPKPDSEKFRILNDIQWEYTKLTQEDSALKYAQQGLEFVQNSKLPLKWKMWQLANLAFFTMHKI